MHQGIVVLKKKMLHLNELNALREKCALSISYSVIFDLISDFYEGFLVPQSD